MAVKQYYLYIFRLCVAVHHKLWRQPLYNNSPVVASILFLSFFESLNVYALLKHLVFPTAQHCAACQPDVRLTITGIVGGLLWLVNELVLAGSEKVVLPAMSHSVLIKRLMIGYLFVSVLLVIV